MSIVKMSRLRIVAPQNIRRCLLRELTRLGCVEIENSAEYLADPQWSDLLQRINEPSDSAKLLSSFNAALETLDKFAPVKSSFLDARKQISESVFDNQQLVHTASEAAQQINDFARQIASCHSEESRLAAKKGALAPWATLDVPLNTEFGKHFKVLFGVTPSTVSADQLIIDTEALGPCVLSLVSTDREQHYFLLIAHQSILDEAIDQLKAKGFSLVQFKDIQGTAAQQIEQINKELNTLIEQRESLISKIVSMANHREGLQQAIDVMTIENKRDEVLNGLVGTVNTVLLEGWTPVSAQKDVAAILEKNGCAYEFSAPTEEEEPPVLIENNALVRPYGMVSELYALPTYQSGLDPNPFMAPFFFIFFGLMMADVGYGILISLGGYFILKKARPQGGLQSMAQLAVQCGLSTIFWGIMFGSYFGNFVTAFTTSMLGHPFTIDPVMFDPLTNPMPLFILSLAFGVVQIFLGLILKGYLLLKHVSFKDALFDVGFWLILLGGLVVCVLNVKTGLTIAALGALGILLTAGREHKNILRRLVGGLGSLYGITSYLSDVLSYSRLLALSLATAVIGQVMNTMGTLGGSTVFGWILFVAIFVIGHIFNLAINILGTFVHTSRLQYIEFFGKFFESGGRKFTPLYNKTKYVEVVKEGN